MYNYFWNVDTKEYTLYDRAGNKVATLHGFPHEQTELLNKVMPALDENYVQHLNSVNRQSMEDVLNLLQSAGEAAAEAERRTADAMRELTEML